MLPHNPPEEPPASTLARFPWNCVNVWLDFSPNLHESLAFILFIFKINLFFAVEKDMMMPGCKHERVKNEHRT